MEIKIQGNMLEFF